MKSQGGNEREKKQNKDPEAKKKLARKARSNWWKRKIIKTHDLPQTRHLKVCLGLSGFGGTGFSRAFGLSSIGSSVVWILSDSSIMLKF